MPEPGMEPGTFAPIADALPLPPSQLRIWIVVKLLDCFDAIGRNSNKHSRSCG